MIRSTLLKLSLVGAAIGLLGCASRSNEPQIGSDGIPIAENVLVGNEEVSTAKQDKPLPLVNFSPEVRVDLLWSKNIGSGLGKKSIEITPAVRGDRVFAADAYGVVEARNRLDGDIIWRTRVGKPAKKNVFNLNNRSDNAFLSAGIEVDTDNVFVGTVDGELIALNVADGSEHWRKQLTSEILAAPTSSSGIVVVPTNDGKLYALETDSGESHWTYSAQDPIITLRGTASPVISGGIVYAGFSNGMLYAINLQTGALLWEQVVAVPRGTSELERITDVDGTPLVATQIVYAGAHQGVVRAINRSDGTSIWEAPEPTHHALVQGYGFIFVVTDDDDVIALEATSGREIWRQSSFLRRKLSDPVAYSNYLLIGDFKGYIHVVAQSDGRLLGRYRGGSAYRSGMIASDGIVYSLADNGKLSAFKLALIE